MADRSPLKLTNLGSGAGQIDEYGVGDTVPVSHGGTGAITAEAALDNLGIGAGIGLISPTLVNGWAANGICGYRKAAGWVEGSLNMTNASAAEGGLIMTLPPGFRPSAFVGAAAWTGNPTVSCRIYFNVDGTVQFRGSSGNVVAGCSFRFPAA